MEVTQYLIEEALILVPVLLIIGKLLKQTPTVKDWTIPYLLLAFGIVLSFLMLGWNVSSFIQGVLVTGASVFAHQLMKQASEAS